MNNLLWVVMAIGVRITSLDPFSLTGIETYQTTGSVLEPLARTHPVSKELIPWLALSWSINHKAGSFRVKLRPGVKFHNGQELSADDVKFTFDAYFDPAYRGEVWRGMWEGVSEVRVIEPLTVEFRCKKLRYLTFENVMTTLRVVPRSFYAPADPGKFRTHIVGSGPFQLARFEPGRALEFKPFPGWWGAPKPAFNLRVKSVSDALLAEQMLRKGELDQYALPSAVRLTQVRPDGDKFQLVRSEAGKGEGLWIDLNLKREIFRDRNVRRALVLLWDRERTNEKLYGGKFAVAPDIFAAKMSYYPKGRPEAFDPKLARELLTRTGWGDPLKPLSFTVLVHTPEAERWMSLYQADAAKAGVRVNLLRLEEETQWWKALREGQFDAVAGQGGSSESVHASSWRTGAPYNHTGFSDNEVDRLIDRLEGEFVPARRRAIESRLIARVRSQIPQLPGLYSPYENFLVSGRIEIDTAFPQYVWRWRLKH